MNLYELIEKYEEMETEIQDLINYMEEWNCPKLNIVEKQIPEELKYIETFQKKDVAPLTGGEKSLLHQNTVEYFVYNDKDNLNINGFLPLIPLNFVTYEREDLAPGLTKVTLIYGQKTRKTTDWRFTNKINIQKDESYFFYDYNVAQYKQVNPRKDEWTSRISEREKIRKATIGFILYYHDLKNAIWQKKPNSFNKTLFVHQFSDEVDKMGRKEFIETMSFFLRLAEKYIFLLQFFGSINEKEHYYLLQAIHKQKDRMYKCLEYISLEEGKILYQLIDVLSLPQSDTFNEMKYQMGRLLTPRKESIEDISPYNYHEGYVYIDVKKGICYPNLGELSRKNHLFKMAANTESEEEINDMIIEIAAKNKK